MSYGYTAAATLMALLLYLAVTMNVGKARMTYKVKAPATSGNEHFERPSGRACRDCPDYKSSKLDGSEDPWTTGARDERSVIGGGSLA